MNEPEKQERLRRKASRQCSSLQNFIANTEERIDKLYYDCIRPMDLDDEVENEVEQLVRGIRGHLMSAYFLIEEIDPIFILPEDRKEDES